MKRGTSRDGGRPEPDDLGGRFTDEITWWVESSTGWHTPPQPELVHALVASVAGDAGADLAVPGAALSQVLRDFGVRDPAGTLAQRLTEHALNGLSAAPATSG